VFVGFLNGREKDLEHNALAILVHAFDRAPAGAPAPSRADRSGEASPMHRPIFLGHDQLDASTQGFRRRVSKQSFRARIPEADAAIGAGVDDRRMTVSGEGGAKRFEMVERGHDPSGVMTADSAVLAVRGISYAFVARLVTRSLDQRGAPAPARAWRRNSASPSWRPDRTALDPRGSPIAPSAGSSPCLSG
jgi:hypothetical protein